MLSWGRATFKVKTCCVMDSSRRSPSAPRKGGGDAEDAEATNRDIEDIDNWVLVSIDSWVRSGLPKDDVIEKTLTRQLPIMKNDDSLQNDRL